MPDGLWIALAIIAAIIVYAAVNVVQSMRKSREQWQQVDRSKLREWDDEDDW